MNQFFEANSQLCACGHPYRDHDHFLTGNVPCGRPGCPCHGFRPDAPWPQARGVLREKEKPSCLTTSFRR